MENNYLGIVSLITIILLFLLGTGSCIMSLLEIENNLVDSKKQGGRSQLDTYKVSSQDPELFDNTIIQTSFDDDDFDLEAINNNNNNEDNDDDAKQIYDISEDQEDFLASILD